MDAETRRRSEVKGSVGAGLPHDSAHLHVSGRAFYTDDIPEPRGLLHVALGMSTQAHAKISRLDLSAVRSAPGVVAVLTGNSDQPETGSLGSQLAWSQLSYSSSVSNSLTPVWDSTGR